MSYEVEDVLIDRIRNTDGVTSLIGTSSSCRFYAVKLPQEPTYPACTYSVVSAPAVSAMVSDTGIRRARFSVSCWASTYEVAVDLCTQVRKALQRYAGTFQSVEILQIWVITHLDLYSDEAQVFQRVIDFQVDYRDI